MKKYLVLTVMLMCSPVYAAWDGVEQGVIERIDVAGGNNYGFRVYLKSAPAMCGNANNWAYVNASDSNYEVFVSVLIAAKAQGNKVTIYSNRKDDTDNGACKIGYISSSN